MDNELLTIKLYTLLTADFLPDDNELDGGDGWEIPGELLAGVDLLQYQSSIEKALQRESSGEWAGNLMRYYDKHDAVLAKVKSAVVSVETRENQLCGCATIQLTQPLEGEELQTLMDYITGQYSDGFGEGFEQREIEVDGGLLFVHLWQPDEFSFSHSAPVAAPPRRPSMRLRGQDGNIFSVLGKARQLLRNAGQQAQVKEMTDRVFESHSYGAALDIISEYVQTELSDPQRKPPEPINRVPSKKLTVPER